ncbi:MAG: hypothetical protein JXA69_01560, partial [Phycisphaerae bacterium]|nr:hypothetical protein [Phycisphaerae bacterium]
WRDSNLIHSAVLAALRDTFLQRDLTSSLSTGAAEDAADDDAESRRQDVRQAIADFFKGNPRPAATASPMRYPAALPSATSGARGSNDPRDRFAPPHESPGPTRMDLLPVESVERDALLTSTRGLADRAMQVHRAYLIAETVEGVIIVDQHALHERVLYEQLRAQVSHGPLESQRLLLPETVGASSEQVATLEVYGELLERLGLEISPFGPNAVAIHAAPTLLREERMVAFVRDLIDKLAAGPVEPDSEAMLEELLQMMACKAAVKAGDALSPEEVEALLAKRETVERSSNCPHGRPTTLRLTLHDLERQFKRT